MMPLSGIANQPNGEDALGIVNAIKDRDLRDFQTKADFMSNLDLRQQLRMRNLFGDGGSQQGQGPQSKPNATMAQDPNQLTGYQRADLGIRQQAQNIESQRLNQQGQLGEQALGVKTAQEQLNQQKSDQIRDQKQNELAAKVNEANQKVQLATQALQDKTKSAEDQLQAHKDQQAAMESYHNATLAAMQNKFDAANETNTQRIKLLEDQVKQKAAPKTTTTNINPEGTQRTTTTTTGDDSDPLGMLGQ